MLCCWQTSVAVLLLLFLSHDLLQQIKFDQLSHNCRKILQIWKRTSAKHFSSRINLRPPHCWVVFNFELFLNCRTFFKGHFRFFNRHLVYWFYAGLKKILSLCHSLSIKWSSTKYAGSILSLTFSSFHPFVLLKMDTDSLWLILLLASNIAYL